VTRTRIAHRLGNRLTLFHDDLQVAEPLLDGRRTATAAGMETLHDNAAAHFGQLHDQLVDIELVVVLGIGDRALKRLFHLLGDAALASRMADALLAEGVYVIGFSYPVVPKGKARIRTQMSAAHTAQQIDQAVAAFAKVGRALGIIR